MVTIVYIMLSEYIDSINDAKLIIRFVIANILGVFFTLNYIKAII